MSYTAPDAMDDIQNAMMKEICPRCERKDQCFDEGAPGIGNLAGCVIKAIDLAAEDLDNGVLGGWPVS